MKSLVFFKFTVICLMVSLSGTGCRHGVKSPTPIGGKGTALTNPGGSDLARGTDNNIRSGQRLPPGSGDTSTSIPIGNPNLNSNPTPPPVGPTDVVPMTGDRMDRDRPMDREVFQPYTVHFDFDRSTIRQNQRANIEAVAEGFKKLPVDNDLLIEGHCDERGTELYNMSLGERRAQAIREYLVNLGVSGDRIQTKTWGEEKPVDPGHDDAAWAKNRRGEFILLLPRAKP